MPLSLDNVFGYSIRVTRDWTMTSREACMGLYTLIFVLALFCASPVLAQKSFDWSSCMAKGEVSLDQRIASCSAIIQLGGRTPNELAIVHYSRGVAYFRQDDPDRAIVDYI